MNKHLQSCFSNTQLIYLFLILVYLPATGCKPTGNSPAQDVLAVYDGEELRRAELDAFLPPGLLPEDSARMAKAFIEDWIRLNAIEEQAKLQIPKLEDRIQYKLKEYRRQLIAQEYADWLIRPPHLDTVVSESEIRNYYTQFPDKFISRANYYQYFHIKTQLPRQYKAVTLMASDDPASISELKEWAKEFAVDYKIDSSFVGVMELERITKGYNHGNIMLRPFINRVVPYTYDNEEGKRFYNYIKMIRMVKPGDPLPLSLCRDQIRLIKLNQRKNDLIRKNVENLLETARKDKKVNTFF
ncbi:MAG: hypothetical protein D6730_24170 [Bacteroidetes bacterium]|nr:MAG: hypothetical protein D6730_24170 [Bacteroidota bacterium]